MTQSAPHDNPYVGPRTFEEKEANRFFGREREARELVALIVSERLTLFFAQSGAGKSSLLNARVIPRLRDKEGFAVLPVGRVSGLISSGVDPNAIRNVFVYHLIQGLSQKLAEKEAPPAAAREQPTPDLTQTSLARFLAGETGPDTPADAEPPPPVDTQALVPHVLVIDQFEELLTTYPDRWEARADFFSQLSVAMARHPNLWVVLTLREDYVASLEPYSHLVPNRLRARFYMQRMGIEAAKEAIERPAADANRPFARGVASMLVDNLRMVRMPGQDEYHAGEYVEPVQLQVVCYQLWEDLREREAATIELADLERLAGGASLAEYVDRALSDFYERAIAKVLDRPNAGVTEQALRRWFSRKLITEAGTRSMVFRNEATGITEGLPNSAVDLLAAQFLLRTEIRAGGAWVELAHDRLVDPIRESNVRWFRRNRSALERQAAIWRDEGKPPDRMLMTGDDLAEAERWAQQHDADLQPHEREFLAASKSARETAEKKLALEREAMQQRELEAAQALAEEQRLRADMEAEAADRLRKQSRLTSIVAVVAVCLALLTAIGAFVAREQRQAAMTATQESELRALEAQVANANAQIAAGNAATAAAEAAAAATAEADARQRALDAATAEADARQQAVQAAAETEAQAFSSELAATAESEVQGGWLDRALLLTVEALRAADTPAVRHAMETLSLSLPEVQTYLHGHDAPVRSLALTRNSEALISGDDSGRLIAWRDLRSGRPVSATLATGLGTILAVAAGEDERLLAAGTSDGLIHLQEGGQALRTLNESTGAITATSAIMDLVLSPDNRFLASSFQDGTTTLWPLGRQSGSGNSLDTGGAPVTALAFSADGSVLATGGADGAVRVWQDLETRPRVTQVLSTTGTMSATVSSLAFNASGERLAVGFGDGRFVVWDLDRTEPVFEPVDAGDASVESLAFAPRDRALAVLLADGLLQRHNYAGLASGAWSVAGATRQVLGTESRALAPDGLSWALGLNSGAIMLGREDMRPALDPSADPDTFAAQACRMANRDLYEFEWTTFIADATYRETCADAG